MIKKNGFTLLELLVVIGIVGLVSTIAVTVLGSARKQARDARVRSDMAQMSKAIQLYINENGDFPVIDDSGQGPISGALTSDKDPAAWQSFISTFMQQKPVIPNQGDIISASGHTNSPFLARRYMFALPGSSATGGAMQHALIPAGLNTAVLVAPIEQPNGTPPLCDGMGGSGAWSGAPTQSTNCQDLAVGCTISGMQWGAGTTWICVRFEK